MTVEKVIVLSGPIGSGKSTVADLVVEKHNALSVKTNAYIKKIFAVEKQDRQSLQSFGEDLDRKTNGEWVYDAVAAAIDVNGSESKIIVVDAVRIKLQVEALRTVFGNKVTHVHLDAEIPELQKRYAKRKSKMDEFVTYDDAAQNPTEQAVRRLGEHADVSIQTDRTTPEDVYIRAASHLGLLTLPTEGLIDVLVGGQYGSEGKGQIAAYLAPDYDFLVRVGGPNAGHQVYEHPKPYTFHQLPSGTRCAPDTNLIIGPGAVINLEVLLREIADCQVSYDRLSIDDNAMVIRPEDIRKEKKLVSTMGSTGQGVGAATARRIMGRSSRVRLASDYRELRPYIRSTVDVVDDALRAGKKLQMEGTQGTGLSLYHGEYPYVTSRDTTASGCLAEAGLPPKNLRKVIVVCRTYPIRVENPEGGSSGPMGQEITRKEVSRRSKISYNEILRVERTSTTNRKRRIAEFNWAMFRQSCLLNGATDVALTFADYLNIENRKARRFEQLQEDTIRFIEELETVGHAKVSLIATRFHFRSIIDRRSW